MPRDNDIVSQQRTLRLGWITSKCLWPDLGRVVGSHLTCYYY